MTQLPNKKYTHFHTSKTPYAIKPVPKPVPSARPTIRPT